MTGKKMSLWNDVAVQLFFLLNFIHYYSDIYIYMYIYIYSKLPPVNVKRLRMTIVVDKSGIIIEKFTANHKELIFHSVKAVLA